MVFFSCIYIKSILIRIGPVLWQCSNIKKYLAIRIAMSPKTGFTLQALVFSVYMFFQFNIRSTEKIPVTCFFVVSNEFGPSLETHIIRRSGNQKSWTIACTPQIAQVQILSRFGFAAISMQPISSMKFPCSSTFQSCTS